MYSHYTNVHLLTCLLKQMHGEKKSQGKPINSAGSPGRKADKPACVCMCVPLFTIFSQSHTINQHTCWRILTETWTVAAADHSAAEIFHPHLSLQRQSHHSIYL